MPKFFITGVLFLLLLGAGYGITQAARSIPWDCADWQAFAHADRTTAILESLAENRGKTLYCGIDQSDTFTKAETWAAGKDRNERDDTVYFGERGIFRGFIAAQEGWLTEGESGVTGVSIDRILSFPGRNGGALSGSNDSRLALPPTLLPSPAAGKRTAWFAPIGAQAPGRRWALNPWDNGRPGVLRWAAPCPSRRTGRSTGRRTLLRGRAIRTAPQPRAPPGGKGRRKRRPPHPPSAFAKPGGPNMSPAAPSSAPAITITKARTGTTWVGFTGRILKRATPIDTRPGKAAPGRPPARKWSGAAGGRGCYSSKDLGPAGPPLPSFPRKRGSRRYCLIMPQSWQAPAGFPLTRE